jgi:hypothetical protein
LEQVRTISRTIMGSVPSRLAVAHLMPIEFVLNVSLLEKNLLRSRRSTFRRCIVNDLSQIIVCVAAQFGLCSPTVTIVLGICLS